MWTVCLSAYKVLVCGGEPEADIGTAESGDSLDVLYGCMGVFFSARIHPLATDCVTLGLVAQHQAMPATDRQSDWLSPFCCSRLPFLFYKSFDCLLAISNNNRRVPYKYRKAMGKRDENIAARATGVSGSIPPITPLVAAIIALLLRQKVQPVHRYIYLYSITRI